MGFSPRQVTAECVCAAVALAAWLHLVREFWLHLVGVKPFMLRIWLISQLPYGVDAFVILRFTGEETEAQ